MAQVWAEWPHLMTGLKVVWFQWVPVSPAEAPAGRGNGCQQEPVSEEWISLTSQAWDGQGRHWGFCFSLSWNKRIMRKPKVWRLVWGRQHCKGLGLWSGKVFFGWGAGRGLPKVTFRAWLGELEVASHPERLGWCLWVGKMLQEEGTELVEARELRSWKVALWLKVEREGRLRSLGPRVQAGAIVLSSVVPRMIRVGILFKVQQVRTETL